VAEKFLSIDSGCPTALATILHMKRKTEFLLPLSGKSRGLARNQRTSGRSRPQFNQDPLPLRFALRVKSAEFWVGLGEPTQALAELARLPERAKEHCSVLRVRLSVMRVIREQNER
jgi:hypothetical protein